MLKPVFVSEKGLATSEHALSTITAIEVLKKGGNAIDASVAMSFALAVVQPALNGLGGDFMAMIYKEGEISFINGSGWAPEDLSKTIKERGFSEIPRYGPLSPVVPGMVYGVYEMWKKYGSLEWGELLKTPAEIAEKGVPVTSKMLATIKEMLSGYHDSVTGKIYNKNLWERIRLTGLAKSIKGIAENGPEFFYNEIASGLSEYVQEMGGVLKEHDFKNYRPEFSEPLKLDYKGYTIYESPPNSQGITTLLILNAFKEKKVNFDKKGLEEILNVYKRAYGLRDKYVGDPRFVSVPVEKIMKESVSLSETELKDGDTTNFVISDKQGNVVSGIQSLYHLYGSRITHPDYMITLNNRASDFKLSGPNSLLPHKRPLHTLSSVIATKDGEISFAFGISGAHYRPQQHFLIITNIVERGMNIGDAIESPRFLWDGHEVFAEEGVEFVEKKVKYPGPTGVGHGIQFINEEKIAYADIRGEGIALGEY